MAQAPSFETQKKIESFISESNVLILDENTGSRVRLASALGEVNIKRHKIDLVGTLEEAHQVIQEKKPKIALCEFTIGKQSSLDLIQRIRESAPKTAHALQDSLFVLITNNNSQSAVARAAEEDVDSFILKPYTTDSLKKTILNTVSGLISPTEYMRSVTEAKAFITSGELKQAQDLFEKAATLDPSPTLALYYLGLVKEMLNMVESASSSFNKGLELNKIHYKCLVGLYENLMKRQKTTDAYSIVKKLAQYFPANPKRLSSVLRLAITTENYDDIESYYRIFTQIESRNRELVIYMCSALIVTAKYYFRIKNLKRGGELLENAAISCAGEPNFLRKIVETLVENRVGPQAKSVLNRFPQEARKSSAYLVSSMLVHSMTDQPGQLVQKGREVLDLGVMDPVLFKLLIESSVKSGLNDYAETLAIKAAEQWSDQREQFLSYFKTENAKAV